ncbi:glycogen/starch/alpha-glucan phosphorylase [Atopobium fossor]|uniref:glycogen/starch/alpha-glucan phosphorylase n=1 Tax=Atopobium fossor TaxID=39487 RepID=UPI0003FDD033|nr:glycogen/starch/alpha-glucan phosphorylase [Atopobium fossor]
MNPIFKSKEEFVEQFIAECQSLLGKSFQDCTNDEYYQVLANMVATISRERGIASKERSFKLQKKKVYYFSLEFLIGPLLDNYLINFGVRDLVADGLKHLGISLDTVEEQECDPGLGNGGLGRLAACFLDSMAHEDIDGYGNGMRYRYGLFHQAIVDGRQVEETDNWLAKGFPWEIRRDSDAVEVTFGGEVVRHEDNEGAYWFSVEKGERVRAVPYDVPIVGFGGTKINSLRLWSAEPVEENFDLDAFNAGNYAKANKFRSDVEAISTILYPNDAGEHGRLLRLKQEYLFVSAGLQAIIRSYKKDYGCDWEHFANRIAIHTNDTHPAMCGPELMRLLVDVEHLDWDTAWDITTHCIAFTNHTVMPEALETWPITTFRALLPRIYMFIDEINRRYIESLPKDNNWQELASQTAVLWDGRVRMANLSIVCGHSINGVSAIHTKILKQDVFKGFYTFSPQKFNNKTNGVSHRRFLREANPALSRVISDAIGEGWLDDATKLRELEQYIDDSSLHERLFAARHENKVRLAEYIKRSSGVVLDPNSVFDVQVKRFHAYKRQLLNVFKISDMYNRMLADSSYKPLPTSFIFAGKAAQSYTFAKEVIRLINSLADVINNDSRVNQYIRVAFVPNFAISNAQLIYPAADISEQISTAGMEGSGTSNMKLMFNGAITLGTYDGANIEIADLVGADNIKIFGMHVEDIVKLQNEGYWAWNEYANQRDRLGRCIDQLTDGTLAHLNGNFESVHDELMTNNDQWYVCKDFSAYTDAFHQLRDSIDDMHQWAKMSLLNTARSGHFSSDRTIREYAKDIWNV